jgi:hypothetical protein
MKLENSTVGSKIIGESGAHGQGDTINPFFLLKLG